MTTTRMSGNWPPPQPCAKCGGKHLVTLPCPKHVGPDDPRIVERDDGFHVHGPNVVCNGSFDSRGDAAAWLTKYLATHVAQATPPAPRATPKQKERTMPATKTKPTTKKAAPRKSTAKKTPAKATPVKASTNGSTTERDAKLVKAYQASGDTSAVAAKFNTTVRAVRTAAKRAGVWGTAQASK